MTVKTEKEEVDASSVATDKCQLAQKMVLAGWTVILVNGKKPVKENWQHEGITSVDDVRAVAVKFHKYNYGIRRADAFVLDLDLGKDPKATLEGELKNLAAVFGIEKLEPHFMQVSGGGGYHIPVWSKGREVHSQQLTELTEIKGWNSQIVGAGSIHPKTGKQYTIYGNFDPSDLTELPDEVLDSLARVDVSYEQSQVELDRGTDARKDEHPPCIRSLLAHGAPMLDKKAKGVEITYHTANLILIDYIVARGYSDACGLWLSGRMSENTPGNHPTTKDIKDKITDFRSSLRAARRDSSKYPFTCKFVLASPTIKKHVCSDSCPHYTEQIKQKAVTPFIPPPAGTYDIHTLHSKFHKHLAMAENYGIDIVPITLLANRLPVDVEMVIIVAPSGSTKTETIRALGDESQYHYPVSGLTP